MFDLVIMMLIGMVVVTLIIAYNLNVLDLYAYVAAVVLFVISIPFGLFGAPIIFFALLLTSLTLGGLLYFYQYIKDH